MRFGSVCSGIEAASVAWHSIGWKSEWYSEIERFPSAVLAHHYPAVPNMGDMTKFKEWGLSDGSIDLLVGGTPCQSFSVAGLRKGLDDPRGNLMLTYLAIAAAARPKWLVWENVPGVLSSNAGRDFGTFLGALGELGYGWSYRTLDAQYFGVAQRRRRVFVVGYFRDWRRAAAVLFERQSLSGHPAPSRKTREKPPFWPSASTENVWPHEVAGTLDAHYGNKMGLEDQHIYNKQASRFLPAVAFPANLSGTQSATTEDLCPSMGAKNPTAVAFAQNSRDELREMPYAGALSAQPGMKQTSYIRSAMKVRRLTPVECERLQGFPDGYTDIRPNGNDTPDGPRYKALGNSMAVPVMRWIGERIQLVENMKNHREIFSCPSC